MWTGTSLQLRLISHEPPLQASSSPMPRIRLWSIAELSESYFRMFGVVGIFCALSGRHRSRLVKLIDFNAVELKFPSETLSTISV